MKARILSSTLLAAALAGCAGMAPPPAEKLASLPVVSYPDKPSGDEFIYKLPAGRPIDVHIQAGGSALSGRVEQTISGSLAHDLYLYKDWASEDGKTWRDAKKLIKVDLSLHLPSYQAPGPGELSLSVDRAVEP